MKTCDQCGGLQATEPMEMIAGTPCKCQLVSAPGSARIVFTVDQVRAACKEASVTWAGKLSVCGYETITRHLNSIVQNDKAEPRP